MRIIITLLSRHPFFSKFQIFFSDAELSKIGPAIPRYIETLDDVPSVVRVKRSLSEALDASDTLAQNAINGVNTPGNEDAINDENADNIENSVNDLENTVDDIKDTSEDTINDAGDDTKGASEDTINDASDDIKETSEDTIDDASDTIEKASEDAINDASDAVKEASDAIKGVVDGVVENIDKLVNVTNIVDSLTPLKPKRTYLGLGRLPSAKIIGYEFYALLKASFKIQVIIRCCSCKLFRQKMVPPNLLLII